MKTNDFNITVTCHTILESLYSSVTVDILFKIILFKFKYFYLKCEHIQNYSGIKLLQLIVLTIKQSC